MGRTALLVLGPLALALPGSHGAGVHKLSARYKSSIDRCKHGHSGGTIVHIELAASPSQKRSEYSGVHHMFESAPFAWGYAGHFDPTTLEQIMEDEHTVDVEADCIVKRVNYMEDAKEPISSPTFTSQLKHTVQAAQALRTQKHAATAAELSMAEQTLLSLPSVPEAIARAYEVKQKEAPWGLDRVDERAVKQAGLADLLAGKTGWPLDGNFNHGVSAVEQGNQSAVYVLDTGVKMDHDDFGGRVVRGWSAAGARTHARTPTARRCQPAALPHPRPPCPAGSRPRVCCAC